VTARPVRRFQLEVCVETVEDAATAAAGGADRLELCAALDLGGLTPSIGLYREVLAAVAVPVWVMIRPRPGDFVYPASDIGVMARDIEFFRGLNPAGFVFGALQPDGTVNRAACQLLIEACGGLPAVFHRAFDRVPSVPVALRTLLDLGFRRILTSGGEATAREGARTIARLHGRAAGRIEVLPCGQVRADHIAELLKITGSDQVHGSFSEPVPVGEELGVRGYPRRFRVARELVVAARTELDRLAGSLSSPT
jgi:copper homeostasis protein CutC